MLMGRRVTRATLVPPYVSLQFPHKFIRLLMRHALMELRIREHARRVFARPKACRVFHCQFSVWSRFSRLHADGTAQVIEQLLAAAQGARNAATDPDAAFAVRLVLLEIAVERERVLDVRRMQIEQL